MYRSKIMLPDIGSSSSHPLDTRRNYLFQGLDVNICVESETLWEDKWRHNIVITSDLAMNWMFDLYHSRYMYWGHVKPIVVLCVYHLILADIFLIWEKPRHVWLEGMLVCSPSSCPWWCGINIDPFFYLVWDIPNAFIHYQTKNTDTSLSLEIDLINVERSFSILFWI